MRPREAPASAQAVVRGDVAIVEAARGQGRSPPAVVAQANAFFRNPSLSRDMPDGIGLGAPDLRAAIEPNDKNGLRSHSRVIADKLAMVRPEQVAYAVRPPPADLPRAGRRAGAGTA